MAQHEMIDALARAGPKQGEVRNPLGIQNPFQRLRNRDIKRLLQTAGNECCDIPGYESLTRMQFMVSVVWDLAMQGERWAVIYITNRVFGRVPLDVEINATVTPDYTTLSDEELMERARNIQRLVLGNADAEVVEAEAPKDSEPLG